MKRLVVGLVLTLLTHGVWGQAGSTSVSVKVVAFYQGKEETGLKNETTNNWRWNFWYKGAGTPFCLQKDAKEPGWWYEDHAIFSDKQETFIPGYNAANPSLNIEMESWEEDDGDNCTYNSKDDTHYGPNSTIATYDLYREQPPGTSAQAHIMRKAFTYNADNRVTYEFFYTPPQPNKPNTGIAWPSATTPPTVCVSNSLTLSTNTYVNPTFRDQVRLYWDYWIVGDYYTDFLGRKKQQWRSVGSYTTANVSGGNKTFTPKDLTGLNSLTGRKQVYFRVRSWSNGSYGSYSDTERLNFDPPGPRFTTSALQASCSTVGTGSIRISNASGAGSYRYQVIKSGASNGPTGTFTGTAATVPNLLPGTYTVRLSNRRSGASVLSTCDITRTVTIGTVSSIRWNSSTQGTNPSCPNGTGSIFVDVDGGNSSKQVNFTITGKRAFSRSGTAYDRGSFLNLPAGSYTVTAHDPCNNTTITKSFTLTPPTAIVATVSSGNLRCNNPKDGSITVAVSSGPGKYDYEIWSGGDRITSKNRSNTTSKSHTFTGLSSGITYQVRVYDDARRTCTPFTQDVTLSFTPLSITSFTESDISCAGETGTIDVVAAGGSGSYSYTLAHSSGSYTQTNTTGSFSVDRGGTYTATVRNRNYSACNDVVSRSTTIIEPVALETTVTQQNITCSGIYNGKLTATISGGTPPYTYQWQIRDTDQDAWFSYTGTGAGTNEISGLYDAHYQLIIADQNGCSLPTSQYVLTDPEELVFDEVNVQHISCQGADDGRITATVSGGWGDYLLEYQREGQTTYTSFTDQTTFVPGTYEIRVMDREGCTVVYPEMVTITEPAEALALQSAVSDYGGYQVTCFGGNDGWIEATATGGNSVPFGNQYRFALDEGPFTLQSRYTELTAGTYLLKVRDERGCIVTESITLSSPDALILITADKNYIQCFGDSTGYVTVQAAGGVAPYQYRIGTDDWQDSPTFDRLPGGDYSLTVMDAQGCQTVLVERMETNDPLTIAFDKTDVRCYGEDNGEITATISGGKAPYNLAWQEVTSTDTRIESLAPGWYTLTITDADNCSLTDSVLVQQPEAVLLTTPVATPVRCWGEDNGQIVLPSDGGTPPYRYSLDGGVTWQSDNLFTNLAPGTYATLTEDSRGCTFTAEATVVEPTLLEVSLAAKTDILCHGEATGAITVQATGGTEPYRYSLNGVDWQETPDFTNLIAGDYQVQLQDERGCEAILPIILIEPGAPLQLTYQVTPVQCKGTATGAIETTITGGTTPYTYQWENLSATTSAISDLPHGDYVLTVTDDHGCQITDTIVVIEPDIALLGSVSSQRNVSCFGLSDGFVQVEAQGGYPPYRYAWQGGTFSKVLAYDNLPEGTYQLVIRDSMDCEVTVETFVSQPEVLTATAEVLQHVSCFGGSDAQFQPQVIGGTQPYRYSLDAGATWQSDALFDGYPIGHYTVLVEDALGCQASTELDITEPPLLLATIENIVEAACTQANGEAQAVAQGGTLPYRYAWINQQEEIVSEEAYPTNLRANVYDVYVTDANNCRVHLTQIINDLDGPTSHITAWQDARCYTSSDGQATVAAQGGTGTYRYQWDDPSAQTGTTAINLARGEYFVTVTDERGCVSISSVTIGSPDAFQLDTLAWKAPSCYEACDGQLEVAVSGGVAPYTYWWEGRPEAGTTLQDLCRGDYTLTVTDAEGCTLTQVLTMTPPDSLQLSITEAQSPTCFQGCDGRATVAVQGGTGPYQYQWNDAVGRRLAEQTATRAANLCPGSYTVVVTDAQGCQQEQIVTIEETPRIMVNLPETVSLCLDQEVTLDATVPQGQYRWTLDGAAYSNESRVTTDQAGLYEVVVTNPRGCREVARTQVTSYDTLFEANFLQTTELYVGDTLTLTEVSFPQPDSVAWRYSAGAKVLSLSPWEPQITFEGAGSYQVTLTGYYSICTDSITKTVAFFPPRENLPVNGRVAQEPQGIKTVAIYPNPTNGRFRVEVTLYSVTPLFVHINDTNGQEIGRARQKNSDHYSFDFDISRYASGQYFLRLMTEHDKKVARILLR